jgi:hypothetical protein
MGHFLLEALRANLMTKDQFLQGGAIHPTGPSPAREVHCAEGDLLLVAGDGHCLEQFRAISVIIKGKFLGDTGTWVLLAEDVRHLATPLSADIVGCIETTTVAAGHGPNGCTELVGVHH